MTPPSTQPSTFDAERERVLAAYRRRAAAVPPGRYHAARPAELLMRQERVRAAAFELARRGRFPQPGQPCLEVGCGSQGWLADLLGCGLHAADLHGIELDPGRVAEARLRFPLADLRQGCATALPWPDQRFQLVIASTLFSSILDQQVRRAVAAEMMRVTSGAGAIVVYDFAFDNPRNPDVRGCSGREMRRLFLPWRGRVRWLHLLPPLFRALERAPFFVSLLGVLPPLRSHRLAVLYRAH